MLKKRLSRGKGKQNNNIYQFNTQDVLLGKQK
jgi:hypothetical protein